MAAFVYLCARPQRGAADAEYESFRSAMRLDVTELDSWDLVHNRLPADFATRWRGAVVGGSPFNVADPEASKTETQVLLEANLAQLALASARGDIAALFTCYGIGVATRTLGGEVTRAYPEDTGPTNVTATAEGASDALFGPLEQSFTVLTAHKEATGRLPEGATLLMTNEACPVQAYRVGDRLYATQFHPEPTGRAFTERMAVYRDDGYFDARDYDRIAERVLAASLTEPPRLLRAFAEAF